MRGFGLFTLGLIIGVVGTVVASRLIEHIGDEDADDVALAIEGHLSRLETGSDYLE